jgi:hypothetical protein
MIMLNQFTKSIFLCFDSTHFKKETSSLLRVWSNDQRLYGTPSWGDEMNLPT